jgi:hypothetical protein
VNSCSDDQKVRANLALGRQTFLFCGTGNDPRSKAGECGLWALECMIYWNWNSVYAYELYSLRMVWDRGSGGLGCFFVPASLHIAGELGEDEWDQSIHFCKK